jgi:hypothetical protein
VLKNVYQEQVEKGAKYKVLQIALIIFNSLKIKKLPKLGAFLYQNGAKKF